jgi:hypothetical protein
MVEGSLEVSSDGSGTPVAGPVDGRTKGRLSPEKRHQIARMFKRISLASLLVLVLLLVALMAARMEYDGSEWFANTDEAPYVLSAVPVGTNATAVLYTDDDHGHPYPPYDLNAGEIAFLDGSGHYLTAPVRLGDVDPLISGLYPGVGPMAWHGTSTGVTFVYVVKEAQPQPVLKCVRVDASTGEVRDGMEPSPGLNASGLSLLTASEGDTIHVLLWKAYDFHDVDSMGRAIYLRSPDGGSKWDPPLELNDGNASALYVRMAVHDEVVSILLLGLRDPDRGWCATASEVRQSFDGGETMGPSVVLSGAQLPGTSIPGDEVGLGEDGSMLAYFSPSGLGFMGQALFYIHPNGTARPIMPVEAHNKNIELVPYADDPLHCRSDVFNVYSLDRNSRPYLYRYETLDLDGRVLDTWEKRYRDSRFEVHILVTRSVGGEYQGVSVNEVPVTSTDVVKEAAEILLVSQDPKTMRVETIGKPYEVVYLHSEAEKADYRGDTEMAANVAWTLFFLVLVTGLVATFAPARPRSWAIPEGTIARLLKSMAIVLPLVFVAGILLEHSMSYWDATLNFIGLFYVAQGSLLAEVYSRTTFRARYIRALHLPFGLYGMILVLSFTTPWAVDFDHYSHEVYITLFLLIWFALWYLVLMTFYRLFRLTRLGNRIKGVLVLLVGFGILLVMEIIMPLIAFGITTIP